MKISARNQISGAIVSITPVTVIIKDSDVMIGK